ncbi:Quinonprotein alcohol dehydrogenase-like protein [Metarhizium rileyi]|uniref:Quinonprotein alcohol dehydrogenase-like protein n=1 Tax=Metarhizium rileyi (strain RCEF 4871) TaxID=1649241 RepID=A0A166Y3E3_METRR|nr:Quinonprotein alcohol dehydrogenase-like protein [Metarhizium rileyi RCEF 4871]
MKYAADFAGPLALGVSQILSSQTLAGEAFRGEAVKAASLTPCYQFSPAFQTIHGDIGNTRVENNEAPLGVNTTVESYNIPSFGPIFWDDHGRPTTTIVLEGGVAYLVALDPKTFEILATYPPLNEESSLRLSTVIYTQVLGNLIVSADGHQNILEIERIDSDDGPSFVKKRETSLSGHIEEHLNLIGIGHDTSGNVWFATGGIATLHAPSASSATVGYIKPDGKIHAAQFENSQIENNFAVNGARVFMVTAPAASSAAPGEKGYLYALEAGPDGVKVVFKTPYEAGDGIKKGALSRGTGASPSLLGPKYVAITDNANGQVNINIYEQYPEQTEKVEPICKVPIFEAGASAVENAMVAYWDGDSTYSVIANNFFNAPSAFQAFTGRNWPLNDALLNGPFNNLTQMAPGMVRVDLDEKTMTCKTRWYNRDVRTHVSPMLSTRTGLLYVSTQDYELALKGSYQYYLAAFDFESGKEVWRVRKGAGGAFLAILPPVLTPDAGVGQCVVRGFIKARDGRSDEIL